jgi:hypothetical protein
MRIGVMVGVVVKRVATRMVDVVGETGCDDWRPADSM